jgi:hypothetical protein
MGTLRTDFLFATPSFLSGIARVLDIFGIFDSYNESRDGKEADAKAMFSDWSMVGYDLKSAAYSIPENPNQLRLNFPAE